MPAEPNDGDVTRVVDSAMSFGRRIHQLAERHPDKPAVVFTPRSGLERVVSWREFDEISTRYARWLLSAGADHDCLVGIAMPNSPEHLMLTQGVWKIGACSLPLNPALPDRERDQMLEAMLDGPMRSVVVADWPRHRRVSVLRPPQAEDLNQFATEPLPDRIPHPGKSIGTGGSTGRSKIILDLNPWVRIPGQAAQQFTRMGWREGQVQLTTTRLNHNMPFAWSNQGLFDDHTIVLMEHFDAAQAVQLIRKHHVSFLQMVPIVMKRIAQLPGIASSDLSSIEVVFHSGAPCPPWLKRAWFDLVGPEKVWEGFGGAEGAGLTLVDGVEWLQRPGTVGKAANCEIRILDDAGNELPPGEVGEIFMRVPGGARFRYLGSPEARSTPDGFVSIGDLGWLDDDGYLFNADRRVDLIISGGVNVYPAEVEAVLSEHPAVSDVVVVPVPDPEWDKRVHAIIQLDRRSPPPSVEELDRFCRERLTAYKVPKSYEFLDDFPREATGKIRRSALATERAQLAQGEAGT